MINGTVIVTDEARADGVRTLKLESVEAALVIHLEHNQADVHLSANQQGVQGLFSVSLAGVIKRADQQTLAAGAGSRR